MFDRTLHHDFLVSHRLRLAALASAVALAACGGGSDDATSQSATATLAVQGEREVEPILRVCARFCLQREVEGEIAEHTVGCVSACKRSVRLREEVG